jgi:hypothetical protein
MRNTPLSVFGCSVMINGATLVSMKNASALDTVEEACGRSGLFISLTQNTMRLSCIMKNVTVV